MMMPLAFLYMHAEQLTAQAHSQKLLPGGSFRQNVDLLNKIEDIFSKIMAF